jgi:hypothetical protein
MLQRRVAREYTGGLADGKADGKSYAGSAERKPLQA